MTPEWSERFHGPRHFCCWPTTALGPAPASTRFPSRRVTSRSPRTPACAQLRSPALGLERRARRQTQGPAAPEPLFVERWFVRRPGRRRRTASTALGGVRWWMDNRARSKRPLRPIGTAPVDESVGNAPVCSLSSAHQRCARRRPSHCRSSLPLAARLAGSERDTILRRACGIGTPFSPSWLRWLSRRC